MSRHARLSARLAAFFASVALAVPAALDADMHGDGPATRPAIQTLHAGGATVAVTIARGFARPGEKLKVRLVATAETHRTIELDVRALESSGTGSERVPVPPSEVAQLRVTIDAAPGGGKPLEVPFAIPAKGSRALAWYDVEVTPVAAAASDIPDPAAARVSTLVWGGNRLPMKFEAPPVLPPEGPFVVGVRIKNTTKHLLSMFGNANADAGALRLSLVDDRRGFRVEPVVDVEPTGPLAPGAEAVFKFEITPLRDDLDRFTILAYAGGTAEPPASAEPRDEPVPPEVFAALDTHTFARTPRARAPEPGKTVVAKQ